MRCNWQEAFRAPDFCAPGDNKLHLSLLPQPFIGDVKNASIYILELNPGLGPSDYYGESEVPEYHDALLANLQQDFSKSDLPFLFLDPKFAWHGGFDWWHGKLAKVIEELQSLIPPNKTNTCKFAEARYLLASNLASMMVP